MAKDGRIDRPQQGDLRPSVVRALHTSISFFLSLQSHACGVKILNVQIECFSYSELTTSRPVFEYSVGEVGLACFANSKN